MPPEQVAMTEEVPETNAGGEDPYREVRMPVRLRISRPTDQERQRLERHELFGREPWVTVEQLEVQVSWMLINLDREAHDVQILVDPWNEYGRYYPGTQVVDANDGEIIPNRSGIDIWRRVPGVGNERGDSSRVSGTFTFGDMKELAIDFATVINILENPPAGMDEYGGSTVDELVNRTFHPNNQHGDTPLTDRYITDVFPALTGFDIGLRVYDPANVALEIVVELLDHHGGKVVELDSDDELLWTPEDYYQLGD